MGQKGHLAGGVANQLHLLRIARPKRPFTGPGQKSTPPIKFNQPPSPLGILFLGHPPPKKWVRKALEGTATGKSLRHPRPSDAAQPPSKKTQPFTFTRPCFPGIYHLTADFDGELGEMGTMLKEQTLVVVDPPAKSVSLLGLGV